MEKLARKNDNKFLSFLSDNMALCVLVVFLVFNIFATPNFLQIGTMNNIIIQMTSVLLIGLGMTWVIASGGIDISVGASMAIAAIVSTKAMIPTAAETGAQTGGWGWNLDPILAIIVGLMAAMASGFLIGLIIAKFRIQPIIVTLTFMIAVRGIAQIMNDSMLLEFDADVYTGYAFFGKERVFGEIPIQLFIMIIAVLIVWFVSNRMKFGRNIQSVGDNFKASYLTGLKTQKTTILIYVMCAFFAGLAGLIATSRISAADANSVGVGIEMDVIAAVAIGGTPMTGGKPKIIGTVIGAVIITLIGISVNMNNIPYAWAQIIKAAIIVLALWSQSVINKRQGK